MNGIDVYQVAVATALLKKNESDEIESYLSEKMKTLLRQ